MVEPVAAKFVGRAMDSVIEVRRHGSSGPAVWVLHGGPGAPGSVAGLAAALADEFRVFEPQQRRAGGEPLSVRRHVDDLAAVVTEPVALVGWSWGAMLGLSFAARHPDSVRSLALVGCGTYDEASRAEYQRRMRDRLGPDGRRQMDALREQLAQATGPDERDRLLADRGASAELAQAFELAPIDEPPAHRADALGHEETWTDVVRLQSQGVEPAAFGAIRAPVLMIHGDHDPHPGPATRDVLRRHIAQLEYLELERCGHAPWKERGARAAFFDALRSWLRSKDAMPPTRRYDVQ